MNRYVSLALLTLLASAGTALAAPQPNTTGDTPEARRTTQALNILEAQGLAAGLEDKSASAFRDFREQGKTFVATLPQDGHVFTVMVDPETGQATRED
jgi:hypothetical protein